MKGLLGSAVAAKAAAKLKLKAFQEKEKRGRLEELEQEFLNSVKQSKEYTTALKQITDDVVAKLDEFSEIDQDTRFKIHNAIAPKYPEWGKMLTRTCFLVVGDDKDRLNNFEKENERLNTKLTELQKRSLQEVVALREQMRDFSPEQEREMVEMTFYDPLDYLPPSTSALCKDIIRESVKKALNNPNSSFGNNMMRRASAPEMSGKNGDSDKVQELEAAKASLEKQVADFRKKIIEMETEHDEAGQKQKQDLSNLFEAQKIIRKITPQAKVLNLPASFEGYVAQFALPDVKLGSLEVLGGLYVGNGIGYGPCRATKAEAENDLSRLTTAVDGADGQRAKVGELEKTVATLIKECAAARAKPQGCDESVQTELDDSVSVDTEAHRRKATKELALQTEPETPKVVVPQVDPEELREAQELNKALQLQLEQEQAEKKVVTDAKAELESELGTASESLQALQDKILELESRESVPRRPSLRPDPSPRRSSTASNSSELEDLREQLEEAKAKELELEAAKKAANLLMWEMQERIRNLRDAALKAGIPPEMVAALFGEVGLEECMGPDKNIYERLYEDALDRFHRHSRRADVVKLFKADLEYYKHLYTEMVRKKKSMLEAVSPTQDQRPKRLVPEGFLSPMANPEHKARPEFQHLEPVPRPEPLDTMDHRLLDEAPSVLSSSQMSFYASPKHSMRGSGKWPQSCPALAGAPKTPFQGPRLGPQWAPVKNQEAAAVVSTAKMLGNYLGGRFRLPNGGIPSPNKAVGQHVQLPPLQDAPTLDMPPMRKCISTPELRNVH